MASAEHELLFTAAENSPASWDNIYIECKKPSPRTAEEVEDDTDPEFAELRDFLISGLNPVERFELESHHRLPDPKEALLALTIENLRALMQSHAGGERVPLITLGKFSSIPKIHEELKPLEKHEQTLVMQRAFISQIAQIVFFASLSLRQQPDLDIANVVPSVVRELERKYLSIIDDQE
ncbi:MAG: hypothetical protein HOO67_04770 [Candidatus Peribacteraceae bacterium]|nr:hypothetical protein [Candidatus Peribacteraceae bacterium]